MPVGWLSWQDAVCLHARDMVSWTYGETVMQVRGGLSRLTRTQTVIPLSSVIACHGRVVASKGKEPPLSNRALFRRDQHLCLYCGKQFPGHLLSRDHVHPLSRGGQDSWMNVVTACKRCNHRKAGRTPDEARMRLRRRPARPRASLATVFWRYLDQHPAWHPFFPGADTERGAQRHTLAAR